jgi:tetratricopeptide (TPR) repeat protein
MLWRFEGTDQAATAHHVARAGLLHAGADAGRLVKLAERARNLNPKSPLYASALAFALHRAGDQEAALQHLKRAAALRGGPSPSADVYDWFLRALVYRRMGKLAEARHWFDKGARAHDHISQEQPPPGSGSRLDVFQRQELRLLRREADALFKTNE